MKLLRQLLIAPLMAVAMGSSAQEPQNDRFREVLGRGELRVGVQEGYKPFGFRDTSGELVGIEVDLARDVAKTLGVKLALVPVQSANRMQLLQQKRIDLVIAAMGDTLERRPVVGMVFPHYFASGGNILAKNGVVKSWNMLKGKPVCAKQGVFYGQRLEKEVGVRVVSFTENADALQALRTGKCIGFLSDDVHIANLLATPDWSGYEMPLESRYIVQWSVGVPHEEQNGLWGAVMSGIVYKWHSSGKTIELAKKWGLQPSKWLKEMADASADPVK